MKDKFKLYISWILLIPFLIIKVIYMFFAIILLIPITLIYKEKEKDFWEEHEIVLNDIAWLNLKP